MIDREKVIDGLDCCIEGLCDCCSYKNSDGPGGCKDELMVEAFTLLKAQEPRKPHYTTLGYVVNGKVMSVKHPECPRCWDNGLMLWDAEIEDGAAYCKRCGQAVKWE